MSYVVRLMIMLLIALPVSLILATGTWVAVESGLSSASDLMVALIEVGILFSVAGPIGAGLISLSHTYLLRRGYIGSRGAGLVISIGMGMALAAVLGLSYSWTAAGSFAIWGAYLGTIYGLAASPIERFCGPLKLGRTA